MLDTKWTNSQFFLLLGLRVVIGYHFLFEGFNKLFASAWSSGAYLSQAKWIFSDLFISLSSSPAFVGISDLLNIWGQIFIGLGLILGLFTRTAAYAGAVLILLYYITYPPFIEGYIFVDRNLLELFGLLIIAVFSAGQIFGIDAIISKVKGGQNGL